MENAEKTSAGIWERPETRPDAALTNRTAADIAQWDSLAAKTAQIALVNGWSKAEVTRRIGMKDATFSQWFSGTYPGRLANQNAVVKSWLEAVAETENVAAQIPQKPAFQMLKMAQEILSTLTLAQATGDMVMVTVKAGNGKTEAARQYRATRPHVYLITASPQTKGVYATLLDLAAELEVSETNSARLPRAIGRRLERIGGDCLIIVDEAQNLLDEAVNQLRHFVDNYGCGLALLGNDEVYDRFKKASGRSYAQIKSRLGRRLARTRPYAEDLEARIGAWGVNEPAAVKFLTGIGLKAGALRQIDKTLTLAGMAAAGNGEAMNIKHIKAAWAQRDVDGLTDF